ncbi:uncharacterized protein (DUF1501 family) [Catenuloplanes nepalensis]|uniref:Uncharacterized protein (DUF1501 family) n=1 Tax=Catenuloplanes nepalensis TaxID=587533 RepID=A0ABT9N1Q2_9ACTN|nr:DUF1501 domain-containing protein [Catenuloplanes nepalensis]MDP9797623.1 uncharacterized protein (DUF1501 family) [Catenuloplanes nepalensis]
MTLPTECGCAENDGLTRRGLLGRGLAAGLAGLTGAGLSSQLAFAAAPHTGDVLVVVSLRGGFDGLSAVVPVGDPDYYAARPGIAVPKERIVAGDAMFGLHPALAPLVPLWQSGKLAAVHAVGQAAPNRSHFAAMEELERAAAGTSVRTGWLDRMLGGLGATGPLGGVAVGSARPHRTLAGPSPDLSLRAIDTFTLSGESKGRMATALSALYSGVPAGLATPAHSAVGALAAVGALRAVTSSVTYPDTELGRALRDVARLIKGNVGLVAAAVDSGDWDMHEGLGARMPGHLGRLAAALAAFAADTAGRRVTLLTISEFGRRVAENGSGGLDHGYGNAMFVLGDGVRGGTVYGAWPGLGTGRLVNGDLAVTTDYRAVIGEILRKRCGVSATALSGVFPGINGRDLGLVLSA